MDDHTVAVMGELNKLIRSEAGKRVSIDQRFIESELDSFGITVVLMELDDKYKIFRDIPVGKDPFETIDFKTFTVRQLVSLCL